MLLVELLQYSQLLGPLKKVVALMQLDQCLDYLAEQCIILELELVVIKSQAIHHSMCPAAIAQCSLLLVHQFLLVDRCSDVGLQYHRVTHLLR